MNKQLWSRGLQLLDKQEGPDDIGYVCLAKNERHIPLLNYHNESILQILLEGSVSGPGAAFARSARHPSMPPVSDIEGLIYILSVSQPFQEWLVDCRHKSSGCQQVPSHDASLFYTTNNPSTSIVIISTTKTTTTRVIFAMRDIFPSTLFTDTEHEQQVTLHAIQKQRRATDQESRTAIIASLQQAAQAHDLDPETVHEAPNKLAYKPLQKPLQKPIKPVEPVKASSSRSSPPPGRLASNSRLRQDATSSAPFASRYQAPGAPTEAPKTSSSSSATDLTIIQEGADTQDDADDPLPIARRSLRRSRIVIDSSGDDETDNVQSKKKKKKKGKQQHTLGEREVNLAERRRRLQAEIDAFEEEAVQVEGMARAEREKEQEREKERKQQVAKDWLQKFKVGDVV